MRSVQSEPQTNQLNWHSAFCSLVSQNTQGLVCSAGRREEVHVWNPPAPWERAEAIITGQHIWFIVALHSPGMVIKYSQDLLDCDAKEQQHPTYIHCAGAVCRVSGFILRHEYLILLWVHQNWIRMNSGRAQSIFHNIFKGSSMQILLRRFVSQISNGYWAEGEILRQTDWRHYWWTEKEERIEDKPDIPTNSVIESPLGMCWWLSHSRALNISQSIWCGNNEMNRQQNMY